jgi:hypothetical protein
VLSPLQGAIACGGNRFTYEWSVLRGNLQLSTTDKSSVKITRGQVSAGAEYEVQLAVKDATSGAELLSESVLVVVGVAELQLTVDGGSTHRDNEPMQLTALLIDPDKTSESVSYDWSCEGVCFTGDSVPEVTGAEYSVAAGALAAGQSYTFTVMAVKGNRTAVTSIDVEIIDGADNPPTGSVDILGSGRLPNQPVSADVELRLHAVLFDTSVPEDSVAYAWQVRTPTSLNLFALLITLLIMKAKKLLD